MDIHVSDLKFNEPEIFNPNGLWFSEIRSVIRAMDYYMEPDDQKYIRFRLMILFSYINFFLIIAACLIIPTINKDK